MGGSSPPMTVVGGEKPSATPRLRVTNHRFTPNLPPLPPHIPPPPATPTDIPFIMATERGPGYDALVGRFPEDEHRANFASDDWLYFIGVDETGADRGFAILQNVKTENDAQFLRRLAVVDAGKEFGRPLLCAV